MPIPEITPPKSGSQAKLHGALGFFGSFPWGLPLVVSCKTEFKYNLSNSEHIVYKSLTSQT